MVEPYTHEGHTLQGALDRLRWVAPVMINCLGSSPSTTIKHKYDHHGLPLHLTRYTKGLPHAPLKPVGERQIEKRLSVKTNIQTTSVKDKTPSVQDQT